MKEEEIRNHEEILAYLQGEMEGEVLRDFELRLDTNQDFAAVVAEERILLHIVQESAREDVRKRIRDVADSVDKSHRRRITIGIAASIMLLAALGFVLVTQLGGTDLSALAQSYFEDDWQDPGLLGPAGKEGLRQYHERNFPAAIEALSKEKQGSSEYDKSHFYLGLAYFGADQPDSSIAVLSRVRKDSTSAYRDLAAWYCALAYLLKSDTAPAKVLLEELLISPGQLTEKAIRRITKVLGNL